jgi:hypothetical protein
MSDMLNNPDLDRWVPLLALFLLALVVIFLLKAALRSKKRTVSTDQYQGRMALFTAAELAFYDKLKTAVGDSYQIFGKVRLADVIEPKKGLGKPARQRALDGIASKNLDFVLALPGSLNIACVIELDNSSHRKPGGVERDDFVESALARANVTLVRFQAQPMYSADEIRDSLADAFADTRELREPRLFR